MRRLVLGPGPNWVKTAHDTFCDLRPFKGVDVVHDLNITPWPFADNAFDEISAIHLVEHLHNLCTFMDQCWRVLAKGGALYIETPEAGSDYDLTHADPTHIRCYRKHTFINYFTRAEAHKFGYTDKLWAILHIGTKGGVLIVHLTPLK